MISGLKLSERFYLEAVRPVLHAHFPRLPHAAALLGSGSEVLGFDDAMSTDHHWGPRVLLFLSDVAHERHATAIREALAHSLPYTFGGYSTHFSDPDPDDNGVQHLQSIESGPVNHRVALYTLRTFFQEHLGVDPEAALTVADWLTFSQQRLLEVTAGTVFRDDIGLEAARARFAYYPNDVWLYLLAAGWSRIGQEEHLMGRAGSIGDELGAALIGARLVRDIMRLCFLTERRYAPYAKWFGSAFRHLAAGAELTPILSAALQAATWQAREAHLVDAYERLAAMHNALALTDPLPEQARLFHGRPFQVIALHGFADALLARIRDPALQRLVHLPPIGSIDQFSDSTDLVGSLAWRSTLKGLYEH